MIKYLVSILFILSILPVKGQSPDARIPFITPKENVLPLRSLIDTRLQKRLEFRLNANPQWKELIECKKMAVGLVDLSNPHQIRFAHINGNEMMYAASLPKIAILLAAMDAMEKGEVSENHEILEDLRIMISRSDNQASTRLIDLLSYEKIETVLTDPKYELYDEDYGGGLWVGKRYAAGGARYPDPLEGLSHAATVSQVCRFYYLLIYGQLVNYQRSKQMLALMEDPELHHKFVNTLDRVAPNATLYRKSGSWRNFHSDSVLVWGADWHRYILVALTEAPNGEQIMRDLVFEVENILKPDAQFTLRTR